MSKKKVFLRGLILFLAIFLVGILYLKRLETPPGHGVNQEFSLQRGWGVRDVALALEEQNLVRSRWIVLLDYRRNFSGFSLQAGSYNLSDTMQVDSILLKFVGGDVIPKYSKNPKK